MAQDTLTDAHVHVHVEFVILIALTAICRKIIILDLTAAPALTRAFCKIPKSLLQNSQDNAN